MLRNRIVNNKPRLQNEGYLHNNSGGTVHSHSQEYAEGVVVSVVVNDDSLDYAKDGYNVGSIKFRFLTHDIYKNESDLNYAFPMEANIQEYPLLNEVVVIMKALNRWYYTRKLNISNLVTHQAYFGLDEELNPIDKTDTKKAAVLSGPLKTSSLKKKKDVLGNYFEANEDVKRLRHQEGDLIIEGRSGHSMRFGINKKNLAPNLLIRVGQGPKVLPNIKSIFSLVKEDVNDDKSSLYMVSDQTIDLDYSTGKNKVHGASIINFPKFLGGNQIILNTDRMVFNTKLGKIMGHSGDGIHWTTNKDFTVDSDRDYLSTITRNSEFVIGGHYKSTALQRYSIISPKIFVGSEKNEAEPMVCGTQLAHFLNDLINIFIKNGPALILTTGAPFSPSPINPKILIELAKLKADVASGGGKKASFNSEVAYTTKKSQVKSSSPNSKGKIVPVNLVSPQVSAKLLPTQKIADAAQFRGVREAADSANASVRKKISELAKEQRSLVKQQIVIIAAGFVPFALPKATLNTIALAKGILNQINKLRAAKNVLTQINSAVASARSDISTAEARIIETARSTGNAAVDRRIAQARKKISNG